MDRYDIDETYAELDPETATEAELREIVRLMKANPRYLLVAYRDDHTDTCRGCYMGGSHSDLDITDTTNREEIIATWADKIDFRARQETPYNWSDYEFRLYRDGVECQHGDPDYDVMRESAMQRAAAAVEHRAEAKRIMADQAAKAAVAAKEAADRAKLRELTAQYGAA